MPLLLHLVHSSCTASTSCERAHCCTWFVLIFYDKILVPLPPYATPQDLHSDSPYISQAVGVRVTSWDQVDVGQSTTAPSYE